MTHETGKFVWYDIMTTEPKAAQAFYRDAVGWSAHDSGMPGMDYMLFLAGEDRVGGLMAMPADAVAAGVKPAWMGYIAVDDVDAHADRVVKAGGSIHRPPTDIPGVGRFAAAADPGGAAFYLFKGQGEAAPEVPPETRGHIGWHELHAGDGKREFDFYADLFGWTKDQGLDMGPLGIYQIFAIGGKPAGGMMTKTPETPSPHWLYYFNVDAIDAAAARATEAGGKVVMGPMEVPGGQWIVQCTDPQGTLFAMLAAQR